MIQICVYIYIYSMYMLWKASNMWYNSLSVIVSIYHCQPFYSLYSSTYKAIFGANQEDETIGSMELIRICCSYLPELICRHRFYHEEPFKWIFHDIVKFWSLCKKICFVELFAITLHIQTTSVAYIFCGSTMFLTFHHEFLRRDGRFWDRSHAQLQKS
jgi:hypothetical protein